MEPVSTLLLAAAFLAPAALTRRLTWEVTSKLGYEASHSYERHTFISLLPGVSVPVTSAVVHKVDQVPTISNREQLKREVKAYSSLNPGWCGINSAVPSPSAMDIALTLIDALPAQLPLPRPMLSFDGELALYWDLQHGYAEVGIERDGLVTFFRRESTGREYFDEDLSTASMNQAWFWRAVGHLDTTLKAAA